MKTNRLLGSILAGAALLAACNHHDGASSGSGPGSDPASCTENGPGGRILRRLSRAEYDATIHDLLGVDSTHGASFTPDIVVNGFDNNASALVVTPLLADQIRKSAEAIAAEVMKSPAKVVPCDPATGDDACAQKLVDTLGKRAFRRPLTAKERAAFLSLHEDVSAVDGFATGVETVIAAILEAPGFLYRTEIGDDMDGSSASTVKLTPYEVASELSYFLWGTMPDDALLAAADSGALSTPEGVEKEARRLIADSRADAVITRFVDQWLEIDRLPTIAVDAATYPSFDDATRADMHEETRRFVQHVVREGTGALPELFLADYTFASPALAGFYGLPAPSGSGFAQIDLGGTRRSGLLTQGSVLVTHSRPNSSSPILRGKVVRERLFCQTMPPPPAGIIVQPPAVDPNLTTRERYAAHATVQPCKGCHQLMDPIGFGFEHFDGIGRYRAKENGKPIDATGDITSTPSSDGDFDGVQDLASHLAESDDVKACFARQWVRFAYGVKDEHEMDCLAARVGASYRGGDLRIDELLVALVKTRHFAERTRDGSEGGGEGGAGGSGSSSSSSTSSTTGGGSTGSGGPTGLDVATSVDSKWDTGYQETVTLTNTSSAPITWTISLPVTGSIANVWNAAATPSGGQVTFTGVDYNAVLAPQASTSFGFIAQQ